MSQPIRGQGGHLVFPIGRKNTNIVEDVEIFLSVKFHWIPFSGFRGKSKMSQPIRGQGGHLVFPISPKNTNLVEDIEILLHVKFRWIPFRGFRGEVKNVSANQRPGQPSCYSDRPPKNKLGSGRWDLAFCQVSLNSVQLFQRRSRKCLSQSEARAAILFFPISPKNTKLNRGRWNLLTCQVSSNSVQRFQRRSRKCLSQSEARAAILFFRSARKNTNLVKDVEIFLHVKFNWILFCGFREVKNVSANQRPGRPSCFSDRPEKHKLGRGCRDFAFRQVSLNSVQRFQRRSRKCLGQSEARAAILFFFISPKNTNLVEDIEILLPVKFRWIPFSGFRGEVEYMKS